MIRAETCKRLVLLLFAGMSICSAPLQATESGKSLYLLGRQGPVAGLIPDKGWHINNDIFYYNSDNDGTIPTGNNASRGNSIEAFANFTQLTWVTGARLLGARLALGATLPVGTLEVDANATGRSGVADADGDSERDTGMGDPELMISLAWRNEHPQSVFSASLYSTVFFPAGSYNKNNIANLGANRWGVDIGTAFSGSHAGTGGEMSGVIGYTINGDNEDTNYDSGNEFHAELSLLRRLSSEWAVGVAGYFLKQITGDNGGPVELGSFKGRVEALGPQVSYDFTALNRAMGLNLSWYHEFSSKNKSEGDAIFLTFKIPLQANR